MTTITRERDFQRLVVDLATGLGWFHYAALYSLGCDPGYPDLTLVSPSQGRVVWLELKVKSKVSDMQRVWITALRDAGLPAYVVTPSDFDQIESLLRGDTLTLDPATLAKDSP